MDTYTYTGSLEDTTAIICYLKTRIKLISSLLVFDTVIKDTMPDRLRFFANNEYFYAIK